MNSRIVAAWALAYGVAIAGASAEETPAEKKSEPNAVAAATENAESDVDAAAVLERLERLSAQLGQIVDEGREAEAREVAQQCRDLLSAVRSVLRSHNASTAGAAKLPQALEAVKQMACDGENCPIDGKLVQNQDLQRATVNEIFAKLREVQVSDEEREELTKDAEDGDAEDGNAQASEAKAEPDELVQVVRADGERVPVLVVQAPNKRGRLGNRVAVEGEREGQAAEADEKAAQKRQLEAARAAFEENLRKLRAANSRAMNRESERELDAFARSIGAQVQEAQRLDNPAQRTERLRDIAGAIREKAAGVVENNPERAFDMLRRAERIESEAREIGERLANDRDRLMLQRGQRDEPPARPGPGMRQPGMMGPPPGDRAAAVAHIPDDPRGKAMMAQRLLMAAGLRKEANAVAEAIEREFATDPATVKRLRAEIDELRAQNARLKAALVGREAALQEQIQARRKEAVKRDRDDREDEDGDDDEGEDEDEDDDEE